MELTSSKKEFGIEVICFLLAVGFLKLVDHFEVILSYVPPIKQYVLLVALLVAGDRILKGVHLKLLESNRTVIDARKALYLRYLEIGDSFPSLYKKYCAVFRYSEMCHIISMAGLDLYDGKHCELVRCWLEKKARLPLKGLSKKTDLILAAWGYRKMSSEYESMFYGCLSGDIIRPALYPSILELVLVWVQYFYFLVELFEINLKQAEYSSIIVTYFAFTIFLIGYRIIYHRRRVKIVKEAHAIFFDYMDLLYSYTQDGTCVYQDIEGEAVPVKMVAACTETFTKKRF